MKEGYFWIVAGLAILAGVVIFAVFRLYVGERNESQLDVQKEALENNTKAEPSFSGGYTSEDKSAKEFSGAMVRYSGKGFLPAKINLKQDTEGYGCLIRVVNMGEKPLTIRLSPHSPEDEQGFAYSPIPPGEFALIDPRYRIPKIAFHNHEKPDDEFSVELGEGCKLE